MAGDAAVLAAVDPVLAAAGAVAAVKGDTGAGAAIAAALAEILPAAGIGNFLKKRKNYGSTG